MSKVLVIDDDVTFASILNLGLRGKGYAVEVAHDGVEGLRKAGQFRPDLIILDVNMPKLSGFDVALRLKGDKELKEIPIILLTALSQDANIERGYSLGIEDYLTKPFSIDHLFLKVRRYLS